MKKICLVVIALFLAGCALQQVHDVKSWSAAAKSEARAGTMKWSDYYKSLYEKVNALPEGIQGRGFILRSANALIDASLAYESGAISKDQFESFQREMSAAEAEYGEQLQRANAQSALQAAGLYNQFLQTQALQAQQWRAMNCTSYAQGNFLNSHCQ